MAFESTAYQQFAERQYTRIRYDRSDGEGSVFVHDVQEPNSYGGWGYLVHATGTDNGELGLVEDLEDAKEIAAASWPNTSEETDGLDEIEPLRVSRTQTPRFSDSCGSE